MIHKIMLDYISTTSIIRIKHISCRKGVGHLGHLGHLGHQQLWKLCGGWAGPCHVTRDTSTRHCSILPLLQLPVPNPLPHLHCASNCPRLSHVPPRQRSRPTPAESITKRPSQKATDSRAPKRTRVRGIRRLGPQVSTRPTIAEPTS